MLSWTYKVFNLNPEMCLCYKMAEHITAAFLTVLASISSAAALCNTCWHQGAGIALTGHFLQQSQHLMLYCNMVAVLTCFTQMYACAGAACRFSQPGGGQDLALSSHVRKF